MTKLPKLTKNELTLLTFLYKFYFLNTNQCQLLNKHQKPQTVQKWLKDLKDKKYITKYDFKKNQFVARAEPFTYSLTRLARYKLKGEKNFDLRVLNRVYRAKFLTSEFVTKCLFIADIYLNILSSLKAGEKLHFSTTANLKGFDFLPDPSPDAYIAIKSLKKTRRSFLFVLSAKIPWKILDQRMIDYVQYSYDNRWKNFSTDPLPSFLIICPNASTQKHLSKTIVGESPGVPFYLTTGDTIKKLGFKGEVWERIGG